MQSSKVAPTLERHQSAPAQASLFLSLPQEIYLKLYERLPRKDVLWFPQICKTTLMQCQGVRQAWAGKELAGILSLPPEQRWTSFLNLIRNCGSAITSDRWESFLAKVAKKSPSQAALLQLAALSPIRGNASHKLISKVHLQAWSKNHAGVKALWSLINGAGKDKWMASAAWAVITGLWRHQCSGDTDDKPYPLPDSFAEMFGTEQLFWDEVNYLPLIQADYIEAERSERQPDLASIRRTYAEICNAHCKRLDAGFSSQFCVFFFEDLSESYLTCLTNLFQYTKFQDIESIHRQSCEFITKSVTSSFMGTAGPQPWRERKREFTLLVFLALQHSRFGMNADDELERRLIAVGFVTAQECMDLFRHVVDGEDDAFHKVKQWLSLNRDKAPEPEPEPKPSCIIS